jgi:uncharacterized protein YecT (DUF1311 family)
MLVISVVVAVLASQQPAPRTHWPSTQTTWQTEMCLERELAHEDSLLVDTERKVRLFVSAKDTAAFRGASALWRDYRDRECRTVNGVFSDGTMTSTIALLRKIDS